MIGKWTPVAYAVPLLLAIPDPLLAQGASSPEAKRLARVLDGMKVEDLWKPGVAVHWRSGLPDPEGRQKATHCSAFAAAACAHLGVYLLRPPEHSQTLLANAQYEWLENEGDRRGWKPVAGGLEAQQLANRGVLVVAVYGNPNKKRPGHIAVVRPGDKDEAKVKEEGPDITQAGKHNHRCCSLKAGFANHPGAFKKNEIKFYSHAVERWPTP